MATIPDQRYKELLQHERFYSRMTKTSAKTAVAKLLKFFEFTCWHDEEEPDSGDGTCSHCPLIIVLGDDAGNRMCLRDKNWIG